MGWARAIELNHAKLTRIVAELIAMVEITVNGAVSNLISRAVLRVLHPAESAVRRLIVIAARGLTVKLRPSRPMPKGRVIARKAGGGRNLFKLFDLRKHFRLGPPRLEPSKPKPHAKAHPRCWTVEPDPPPGTLIPLFLRQPAVVPAPAVTIEIFVRSRMKRRDLNDPRLSECIIRARRDRCLRRRAQAHSGRIRRAAAAGRVAHRESAAHRQYAVGRRGSLLRLARHVLVHRRAPAIGSWREHGLQSLQRRGQRGRAQGAQSLDQPHTV